MGASFSCPGLGIAPRQPWADLDVALPPPTDDDDVDGAYLLLATHRGATGLVREELARLEPRLSKWQQTQLFKLGHVETAPTTTECIEQLRVLHYRRERAIEPVRLLRLVIMRARRRWVRLFTQEEGLQALLALLAPAHDTALVVAVLDLVLLLLSFVSVLEHLASKAHGERLQELLACLGGPSESVSIKVLQICRIVCVYRQAGHVAFFSAMEHCHAARVVADLLELLDHGADVAQGAVLRLLHALLEGDESPQLATFAKRLIAQDVPAWLAMKGDDTEHTRELDTVIAFEAARCLQLLRRYTPPPDLLHDAIQQFQLHAKDHKLETHALKVVTALLSVTEPSAWDALVEQVHPAPIAPLSPHLSKSAPAQHHPRYAKYFRMLEVRVPRDLVRQRMIADGVDAALLDAPTTIVSDALGLASPPTSPAPVKPPKGLHWQKWASSDAIRGTIWEAAPTGNIDADEVHVAFEVRAPTSPGHQLLLHPRRAKHIRKLLDTHHLTLLRPSVADALLSGKVDGLTFDQISHIRHVLALPTLAEKAALQSFDGNVALLTHPEGFLRELLVIPDVERLLDLLAMVLRFDSTVQSFERDCAIVATACKELSESNALHAVLGYVLDLGNHINAGTSRGNAVAFNLLTDLEKLGHVRQASQSTGTALHFLASVLRAQDATLLAFGATLPSLELVTSSHMSASELHAQLQRLHAHVLHIANTLDARPPTCCVQTFTLFLEYAATPLNRCDATWAQTIDVLETTMRLFLNLPTDTLRMHAGSFFRGIHRFTEALAAADRENCQPLVLRKSLSMPLTRPHSPLHRSHSMAS
ncbi:hypothetical protein SPRG_07538 [Saprolegnia parasitica CBS 223.65]|uniref:FH2 domain-containing protein n=1 Tax=Saprolegnia parasitica (strain CBS 223.65) TaxID=695850 RepID=A0A067C954_SAPPC|nr:hypothetical protein SPRG_07538 [Saprolegnia parasitica CBS 223.65]KDO27289.1 hypothetical protein SPRG_07538 [Saprolegnia parasitica CBS 223.65]|eukprot:XP_012202064.1 hypothetical protein SPRG_07538 [Saprolegnia parasitica CBS 223.65]